LNLDIVVASVTRTVSDCVNDMVEHMRYSECLNWPSPLKILERFPSNVCKRFCFIFWRFYVLEIFFVVIWTFITSTMVNTTHTSKCID